jgi:C1A family cysteine protease
MRILLLFFLSLFALADKPYIHPDMQRAIDETESAKRSGKAFNGSQWVVIDGKRYYTGFHPDSNFYAGGSFKHFKSDPVTLPKSFDIRKNSHSPVRGQIQGSCWAEGNVSAFELTWNFINGTKTVFAVNDVIDCSGYGSASSGGQLSMQYNTEKGLAHEADYPYTGKDGRCKKDVARHNPLKAAPFLRGANGGFPTEKELMAAAFQYGALEVCGSASALGSGGRQDTIRNGVTNHCYAYAGWLDGKEMGWLDAKYHIIKNSWGDGSNSPLNLSGGDWGDNGYGYYRISTDGVRIRGSVITEIQVADTGLPLHLPMPKTFKLENQDIVLTVTVDADSKVDASKLSEMLKSVFGGMQ